MMPIYPVKLLHCPLCGKAIFERVFDTLGRAHIQVLPNQCQFPVWFKDGGRTDIGMCIDCFDKATDIQILGVFEGLREDYRLHHGRYDMEVEKIDRDGVWNRENSDGTTVFVRPL